MADPAFNGAVTHAATTTNNPATISHTVGSSLVDSMLIVMVNNIDAFTFAPATDCTWGGVAMHRLYALTGDSNPAFFFLQAPASGTANIVVTWGNIPNPNGAAVTIATLVNVSQYDHIPKWVGHSNSIDDHIENGIPSGIEPSWMVVGFAYFDNSMSYSSTDQTLLDGPFAVTGVTKTAATFYGLNAPSIRVNFSASGLCSFTTVVIPPTSYFTPQVMLL